MLFPEILKVSRGGAIHLALYKRQPQLVTLFSQHQDGADNIPPSQQQILVCHQNVYNSKETRK